MMAGFAQRGQTVELVDWNKPSFATLTTRAALEAIDEAAGDAPALTLIGSSMGGYLSALWTELHPERVARAVLLCPAFDLISRWPTLMGEQNWRRWQQEGSFVFNDGDRVPTPLHWGFIEDARRWPTFPEVSCPTLILHGIQDETVPVESSRFYASTRPNVRLVELEADHRMLAVSARLVAETLAFVGL
jgi:uncharacterized protein